MTTNEEFEVNHKDRVTCLHINYDGTRILTGSIDHRINIWSVSPRTQERALVDTWTAHDADIRDAKWLHPSTGTHLGTVGNDLKLHLWGEELSQAPNSGRRFRRLCTIDSPTRVPFVSLDFRNIDFVYTFLAVIDRQGLLSIYEPTNPDEFNEWTLVDRWNVAVPIPGRGDQTSFKVRWDHNVLPLPYVCGINNDRRQLSLVVTAGTEVKIYRGVTTDDTKPSDTSLQGDGEASHRITFYEATKLPAHPALIRDVQWAPFNVRGTDLFATACKDGAIRIFEMSVTNPIDSHHASTTEPSSSNTTPSKVSHPPLNRQQTQTQSSNLTSAIASRTTTTPASTNTTMSPTASSSRYTTPRNAHPFPYTHNITMIANLEQAHDDAWSVSWDPNGQVLISGGADGATKIWRRSVLDVDAVMGGSGGSSGAGGKWMLFADQAIAFGSEASDDGDEKEN